MILKATLCIVLAEGSMLACLSTCLFFLFKEEGRFEPVDAAGLMLLPIHGVLLALYFAPLSKFLRYFVLRNQFEIFLLVNF
mmetsp:Transcript_18454/g.21189  ORF Transcript_18454/g.21189 Transcript_18454/m.21189 type:complete len:81 (-) Transcript_18454:522-764(-)